MHNETTKALHAMFSDNNKGDFLHAYIYLKHIKHFVHHIKRMAGIPSIKPDEELDEEIEVMLEAIIQDIADAARSRDTSTYHLKVLNLKDAIQLVTQKEDISVEVPETVVPYKQAKDIILNNPASISVGECACRATSENPCLPAPMEVCMFVGEPHASFIAENNEDFRKISQEEAVEILNYAHEKGFVHCAEFKKELGRKFIVICNCCSCCCLGIQMWNTFEGQVTFMAPSGYVAKVGTECTGCGECVDACHFHAISMNEEEEKAIVTSEKCMGCGVCESKCPADAIKLQLDPSKGEPLDLERLLNAKDE